MTRQLDLAVQGIVGTNLALSHVGDNARPYCRFRVAITPTYRTEQGWNSTETIWFTIKAQGQSAANLSHSLCKGDAVLLIGCFSQESWESNDRKHETNVITLQAASHDLTRGESGFARVGTAGSAPPASSGAGVGDAEFKPGGEERVPSDHWKAEAAAPGASASPAPGTGDPRESAGSIEPSKSTESIEPTESTEPAGSGQSSMTHARSPEPFAIDPACACSEDQTGEPWPVYEFTDDLVEQTLEVN